MDQLTEIETVSSDWVPQLVQRKGRIASPSAGNWLLIFTHASRLINLKVSSDHHLVRGFVPDSVDLGCRAIR